MVTVLVGIGILVGIVSSHFFMKRVARAVAEQVVEEALEERDC